MTEDKLRLHLSGEALATSNSIVSHLNIRSAVA